MKSSSSENQQVSPKEKQNLLNKFVELQLAFTLAINEEDRTVTQQERERSDYIKAWLLHGSGHIYYNKMTEFNAQLRQVLNPQSRADSDFQDALWGEVTMTWEDDYRPIPNYDAKPGLSSGDTELLSTFLDLYPQITLFLIAALSDDKSVLTELREVNRAIEERLQAIEGPRLQFVDKLLVHPERKTTNNVTSGYPKVAPLSLFQAFFDNYKNLPPKPLENKSPATVTAPEPVMRVMPCKATGAPTEMSKKRYEAAFYKAFLIANPGKEYNNETEEAGKEFNKVSLATVVRLA